MANNPNRPSRAERAADGLAADVSAAVAAPVVESDPAAIARKYALSWAIINSDPGLRKWFNNFAKRYVAANGQISPETFQLELEATPFWRQHSATWIADLQQELENPADYAQSLTAEVATLRAAANQLGARVDDAALEEIAKSTRRFGWSQDQQRRALAEFVSAVPTEQGGIDFEGLAGQTQDELTQWAARNGVALTNELVQSYTRGVVFGDTDLEEIKSDIRRTYMAGAYPAWAEKINAGFDVAELAAPYQQQIGSLLENPSIGLDDPLMKQIMQGVDAQGKPRVVPMYEAEKMVRNDSRWQTTDNAYQTYAGVAQNLLRTFGFG